MKHLRDGSLKYRNWLDGFRVHEALSEIRRERPSLPQVLKSAYSEWNHVVGDQQVAATSTNRRA